jgi:hypothetical protein
MIDTSEHSRAEFRAAYNHVSNMNEKTLTEFFDRFFLQLVDYDASTDAIILQFELDAEKGIDRWRLQHLDLTRDGNIFDKQKAVTQFEGRSEEETGVFGDNKMGINTVSIVILNQEIQPDDLRPILEKSFERGTNHPDPSMLIVNPGSKFIVEKESNEIVVHSIPPG